MTAHERTEKLILEIAWLRGSADDAHQFTSADFSQYLATHEILIDEGAVASTLRDLMRGDNMQGIENAYGELRYRITSIGVERLDWMRKHAMPDAETSPVEYRPGVAESALDGWWNSLADDIKVQLFNAFYGSRTDVTPKAEAA